MVARFLTRLAGGRHTTDRPPVAAHARAVREALHRVPDVRESLNPIERQARMIKLHHGRDQREIWVNADLLETVEATPDTVLTLTTGKKLIVGETPEEIVALCLERKRLAQVRPQVVTAG